MKKIVQRLLLALGLRSETYKIQSFTYFIPSPPSRKSGYREKHFDKVFYEFINRGYKILDMKTQSSSGAESSGMWIIFTIQATNKESDRLDLDSFFNDQVLSQDELKSSKEETIEGLYQINS